MPSQLLALSSLGMKYSPSPKAGQYRLGRLVWRPRTECMIAAPVLCIELVCCPVANAWSISILLTMSIHCCGGRQCACPVPQVSFRFHPGIKFGLFRTKSLSRTHHLHVRIRRPVFYRQRHSNHHLLLLPDLLTIGMRPEEAMMELDLR